MEIKEIEEPKRTDLYWAKYWLKMKEKTGCDNFDENAKNLKAKIETTECFMFEKEKIKEHQETLEILNAILGVGEK